MIMIHAVSNMWLLLDSGWAFACVLCAWCMRGKKGACKISKHPFNFSLSGCVCMFWQEMASVRNEAVVHGSVEGLTKNLRAPRQHPILHLSSDSWPTWFFTLEYMWLVILAETTTRKNKWYLHRGWSILGFPVPVVSVTINRKNRALHILFDVSVPTSLRVFLVISPGNYKVASFWIRGLKLQLNNADNFGHSNGVLVTITLFFRASVWNLRFMWNSTLKRKKDTSIGIQLHIRVTMRVEMGM